MENSKNLVQTLIKCYDLTYSQHHTDNVIYLYIDCIVM